MLRPTCAFINLGALSSNIQTIKHSLQPGVQFLAVVKANAYGHGILEVAKAAVNAGADYLGVAIPEEGKLLREAGITTPILVLSGLLPDSIDLIVSYDLYPTVFSVDTLLQLVHWAKKERKCVPVHVKVDTGMNRIGVRDMQTFETILHTIQSHKELRMEGLFTHFAVSELKDKSFTMQQAEYFQTFIDKTHEYGIFPIIHASNSGGILDLPQLQYDMVRGGLVMYGYYPGEDCNHCLPLHPILSWKTHVAHVKDVLPGETISYGRTFTVEGPMRIATLPVGYGDGYKRILSNKGYVLLHGKRIPIVGTICMDQLMCDVTKLQNVSIGDEAVLLGVQGNECIDADEMALWAQTISYEILLSISERVPRVYES